MAQIHEKRLTALQKLMAERGIDCVFIGYSPNMYYMTDFSPKKDERFQAIIVPREGEPEAVVPVLYVPQAEKECTVGKRHVWRDGDDLQSLVGGILDRMGVRRGRIAIDSTMEFRLYYFIRSVAPGAEFVPADALFTVMRMRKSAEELALMRKSCELSDWSVGAVLERIPLGESEAELKNWVEFELNRRGMRDGFSNLIAFGDHTGTCHHTSGDRRPRKGDAVYLDLGGAYGHYWSDITRSFHIGKPSDKYIDSYNRVREAQQAAFEYIRPGVRAMDVHQAAVDYLKRYGLDGYFVHRLGHGMGLDGHELPNLEKGCDIVLEPGMTFSDEPGVYFFGEFGIRIEDTVCVTETGAERLTKYPKDLVVIDM